MKRIIIDLDGTITARETSDYDGVPPNTAVIERLREYREQGFEIVLLTSRNMRTYDGNVGKINVHTLPKIIDWLRRHDVPYDEIHVGKPWCGYDGFYVDDKTVRPSEFRRLDYAGVRELLAKEAEENG